MLENKKSKSEMKQKYKNDKCTRNGPGGVNRKVGCQKQRKPGPAQNPLPLLPLNRPARALYRKCYLLIL